MVKHNAIEELEKLSESISALEIIPSKTRAALAKQIEVIKKSSKTVKRAEKPDGEKPVSHFQKAYPIHDDMLKFAGWEPESCHSRIDITKAICAYAKEHDLQDAKDKRIIHMDDRLRSLLKYDEPTIKYPHIQKYIGVHIKRA